MVSEGTLTSRAAKDILLMVVRDGGDPEVIAKEHNMLQQHDEGTLQPVVEEIISKNEKIVADFKAGKEAALQALVGQVMKATKGSANPAVAAKILREMILK